jgi:hypothetical protein
MKVGEFKNGREKRYVMTILIIQTAIVFAILFGVQAYCHYTFPKSVATILDVWEEKRQVRRSPPMAVIGLLEFIQEVDVHTEVCRTAKDVGWHPDRYQIGERLEVIPAAAPATGSM